MQGPCDLSIAAEHARFIQPGTRTGSVSAGGATQWLPLAIGDKRSRWMVMVGDEIDAKTALEWGLVNEVVPYEKLDEAVRGLCEKLINKFPDCMRYTKVQCNFWGDLAWTTSTCQGLALGPLRHGRTHRGFQRLFGKEKGGLCGHAAKVGRRREPFVHTWGTP